MKTYQYMWRMIRFRPWLYLVDCVLWTLIHVAPVLPGLVARAILDTLTGNAQLGLSVWALIGLLMAIALGRGVLVLGGALADIPHRFSMSALLRRNLLERILELPGARALPESTGETLSRFRDDAEQAEDAISWTLDVIGTDPAVADVPVSVTPAVESTGEYVDPASVLDVAGSVADGAVDSALASGLAIGTRSPAPVATSSSLSPLQRQYSNRKAIRLPSMASSRMSRRTSSNATSSARYSQEQRVVTNARPWDMACSTAGALSRRNSSLSGPSEGGAPSR